MRNSNEHGIAMITTLLVLMLISALLVGFTTMVMSDQRFRFIDHDRGAAFYAASGAVEKLTADLGNQYFKSVGLTQTQINTMTATASVPVIAGITYAGSTPAPLPGSSLRTDTCIATPPSGMPPTHIQMSGTAGYTITFCADNTTGNPTTIYPQNAPIKTGPCEGLIALQTPFQLDVTAKTARAVMHLSRTIEAVAIPVFQFGMFRRGPELLAAEDFAFGGRVQTNGNLYLAEGAGGTLTMNNKITAVKEVVRQQLSNGVSIDTVSQTGTVSLASSASTQVPLLRTAGSVVLGPTSAQNEPTWHTTSLSTFNGWLRNGRTGAKVLSLPLVMPGVGGSNPDLVRRPTASESSTSILYNERLFSKASLRILLSDTPTDITALPTVTSGTVYLDGTWNSTGTVVERHELRNDHRQPPSPSLNHPPLASPGYRTTAIAATTGTGTVGGTSQAQLDFDKTTNANLFKPTFQLCQLPPCTSTVTFKCDAKTATSLTGCVTSPTANTMPITTIGATVVQVSPANGAAVGASSTITNAATLGTTTTLTFTSTANFNPLPIWNTTTNALITCTGWSSLAFTGCGPLPSDSTNTMSTSVYSNPGISQIGGYLKVERQNTDGSWHDVTMEMLNYGIGWVNDGGTACNDPTPNAVLRLQRLRDNAGRHARPTAAAATSTRTPPASGSDRWWPMVLFDTREGVLRDSSIRARTCRSAA